VALTAIKFQILKVFINLKKKKKKKKKKNKKKKKKKKYLR